MANREGEALRQAEPKGAEAKARGHCRVPEHLSKFATSADFGVPFTDWPTWLPFRCQVVQAIARHALASITLDAAESSTEAREEGMYP